MDQGVITGVWRENFPDLDQVRYAWMYQNNPAGPAHCQIARDLSRGEVLGSAALFPRRMFVDGKECLAGVAGDFSVKREHRAFGPALSLLRRGVDECLSGHFDFLFGFPNSLSEAVLVRAGYKAIGQVRRFVKPLQSRYLLEKWHRAPGFAKAVTRSVDMLLTLAARAGGWGIDKRFRAESPARFDSRFDELWRKACHQEPVIGERSAAYLNWRYVEAPHRRYHIYALSQGDGAELAGYIVYWLSQDERVHIVDLLAINWAGAADALLSMFLHRQRRERRQAVCISYAGTPDVGRLLRNHGFLERKPQGNLVVFTPECSPFREHLLEQDKWYALAGDNDV